MKETSSFYVRAKKLLTNTRQHGALPGKPMVAQSRISQPSTELNSLLCSQEHVTDLYLMPVESSPHPSTIFP
jgi:hypothetical protein